MYFYNRYSASYLSCFANENIMTDAVPKIPSIANLNGEYEIGELIPLFALSKTETPYTMDNIGHERPMTDESLAANVIKDHDRNSMSQPEADGTPSAVGAACSSIARKRKRTIESEGAEAIGRWPRLVHRDGSEVGGRNKDSESDVVEEKKPWMEMYQRLEAYNVKYRNTRVSRKPKADSELADLTKDQRLSSNDEDEINLLNDIGIEWNVLLTSDWGVMYQRLWAYKKKYGNTCVPRSYTADPQLAKWVKNQRQHCKEKDRIDLLNDIDFEWSVKSKSWAVMYQRLIKYKKEHGTTCVPTGYKEDPKLVNWVKNQRKNCKKKDRIDLLNGIGFAWIVRGAHHSY